MAAAALPTHPEQFAQAERIRSEFVLAVAGKVRKRTPENVNPRMASGEIEILVQDFVVLNAAETPPFELDDHTGGGKSNGSSACRQTDLAEHRGKTLIQFYSQALPSAASCTRQGRVPGAARGAENSGQASRP